MDAQMGTIIVRNVPKEVRWTLKEKAASEKKSVNQVILELIGEYLAGEKADGRRDKAKLKSGYHDRLDGKK